MALPYPFIITYVMVSMNQSINEMMLSNKTCQTAIKNSNGKTVDNINCPMEIPALDQYSISLINQYLEVNKPGFEYGKAQANWRVLKYDQSGYIKQHKDMFRNITGYEHIGTQIFLPPYSQVQFQGGELIVWHGDRIQSIKPHDTQWTHVILPLNMLHKVNRISKGIRISYTKSIYIRQKIKNQNNAKKQKYTTNQAAEL